MQRIDMKTLLQILRYRHEFGVPQIQIAEVGLRPPFARRAAAVLSERLARSGEPDYAPARWDFSRLRLGLPVPGDRNSRHRAISSARAAPERRKWPTLHFRVAAGAELFIRKGHETETIARPAERCN